MKRTILSIAAALICLGGATAMASDCGAEKKQKTEQSCCGKDKKQGKRARKDTCGEKKSCRPSHCDKGDAAHTFMRTMLDGIELNDLQRQQVQRIEQQTREELNGVTDMTSKQYKKALKNSRKKLEKILTKEQKAVLDANCRITERRAEMRKENKAIRENVKAAKADIREMKQDLRKAKVELKNATKAETKK